MYRNKKINRKARTPSTENVLKPPLTAIDENSTIKLNREENENLPSLNVRKDRSIFDDEELLREPTSSEENIPASQEPSQRYLSQRSNFASTLGRTQSWNNTTRPPNTYFELSLIKAGVQLNETENFILSCDHVAFVVRFRELLKGSQNHPENIETFKAGLKQAFDPKSKLSLKLLSGCTISSVDKDNVYQSQDSMIANFLMIDFLCKPVLDVLFERIESSACDNHSTSKHTAFPLLPLMLAQLRYVVFSHGQIIYERIKNIFERATQQGRIDIIANAELILEETKHDEFTQMLLVNIENSQDFFNAITLTTLSKLYLSAQMQCKIRAKIVHYIMENSQNAKDVLPLLVKFMLKILSEDNEIYICELVNTLRKILLHQIIDTLERPNQIELFRLIEQGLMCCRKFYTNWQKTIVRLPEREFGSFDFIVLLMLIHVKDENLLYIENILRRKIKNENLSLNILHSAKNKYPAILEKYTTVLLSVMHNFLKEKHNAVWNFARSSYEILFQICESVQKSILKNLLQLTCDKSAQNMTNTALELLKDLRQKHPKEIQNWGMMLMPLLDRLNEMTLPQTRLIMELLCSIAYPPPTLVECPSLQEQINMLVKKQMINRSSSFSVRKQGILGCAQLIDCMARTEDICQPNDEGNSSYATISHIPEGRGKIAAQLFERVKSVSLNCPESLALFYDELASILISSREGKQNRCFLNKPFLLYLNETLMLDFQNSFVTCEVSSPISGVPLSSLKCINNSDEVSTEDLVENILSVCIKISDLVLNPSNEATSSILVMSPAFNLLRVLCTLCNEGSLEQLDATLGCAITLPTFFDDEDFVERIRNDFEIDTQMKILDIYFHCANWFREIISSFITQIDDASRKKCLQRLNELVKTESKIRKLLSWSPSHYTPPKCQFLTERKEFSNKKAHGRPARVYNQATNVIEESEANNTTMGINKTMRTCGTSSSKPKADKLDFDNIYGPKEIYRQMDANIVLFLRENVNINMPFPEERIGSDIGLPEYHFVLTDLVQKLETIVGVQKMNADENLEYISRPYLFINDLSTQLTHIYKNAIQFANAINVQLNQVNHIYGNVDLFSESFCYLRACFDLSLRLFAAYFSWSEFAENSQTKLLLASLGKLYAVKKSSNKKQANNFEMVTELFNDFLKFESSVLDLKTAVNLHNLLAIFRKFSALNDIDDTILSTQATEIRSLCKTFLQRKWYNYAGYLEKGVRCNMCLDTLVKGFLKNCDFKPQREIIALVLQELNCLTKRENYMKSFPNINKANFPILYRGLCEALLNYINDLIINRGGSYAGDKLRMWEESCNLLNELLAILRGVEIPRNFQIFVKYAHIYIKVVIQNGLAYMEECLRQESERIFLFLKSLQKSTRFLHSLCCQTKNEINNIAIVNQIPNLRETMEVFVFHVKAMLLANKCESAWSVGLLRNKDTYGELILSQSVASLSDANESEEEIPEDDVTCCESLLAPDDEPASSNIYVNVRDKNGTLSKISSRSNCI